MNCTAVKNGKTGNSDSENDAVDVEIESPSAVVSNDHPQTATKPKEKTENSRATKAKQNQKQRDTSDDDEEVIDVEGIEEDETFLTIGNTTQYLKSTVVDKSPVAAKAESFVMSESFVLEGTKHKTMSPEFGSCSDSQPDVNDAQAPKVKKSRIPVRKKGVSVNIKQRATRGKQKKVQGQENGPHSRKNGGDVVDGRPSNENKNQNKSSRGRKQEAKQNAARGRQEKAEESTIEGHEDNGEVYIDNVEVDNAGEVDEETESFSSREGQSRVTRGRKNKVESSKVAETEALEVDNDGVAKKGKRRAKSMPGTKVQAQRLSKSSKNDGKSSAVFSDEGLHENEEQKRGKGRRSVPNTRQQQKEPVKGRKEKTEVREDKSGDVDADNHEKLSELKTGKQRKNVAKGSESDEQIELSGRKTRAQRRKEADNKLQGKDGGGEGDEEGGVDDVIEDENEASNDAGYEKVGQGKTRAQRKKTEDALIDRKDGNGGKEGVGGGSRLEDVEEKVNMPSEGKRDGKAGASKRKTRASRKRQANTERRDESQEEEEEEEGNIADSALVPNVADQEDNGVMESEDTEHEDELYATGDAMANNSRVMALHTVDELDEDQSSSDKAEQETRSGSTIVSNNASSSSESRKKDNSGTGRRRRKPSVLPPYAVKRRANKVNSSKASVSSSSPESTTESEQGTYAKKPRLEEVLTEKEAALNSGKRGAKTWVAVNSRKSGGGAHSGGNSKGGNKSVAQKKSAKSSKDGHEKSLQNADENEGYDEGDVDYSVSEDGGVEGRTFEEIPSEDTTPRPPSALGKPATELKSILKSGGPVVRTHAGID